jgi:hypothetical protein
MKNIGDVLIQFLAVLDSLNRRVSGLEQQLDQSDQRAQQMGEQITIYIQQLERESQSMHRFFEGTLSARLKTLASAAPQPVMLENKAAA